jgi:hypothetical protein
MKSSSSSISRIPRLPIILSLLGAISAPVAQGQVSFSTFMPFPPLPYSSFSASVVGKFVKNAAPGVAVIGVSSSGVSSLSILTNDGTGALSLAHTYVLPQPGSGIATADLNRDGNLDLVVTGNDSTSMNWSYSVLLGNGDGNFQPPVLYQQSLQAGATLPIVIADFNGDGKLDMAVPVGNSVAVLLGNGDGTFSSPHTSSTEVPILLLAPISMATASWISPRREGQA